MQRQEAKSRIVLSLLVATAAASALWIGACSSSAKVESHGTTVGQELKDLEDARNKGLLTEEEYNRAREEIVNRK